MSKNGKQERLWYGVVGVWDAEDGTILRSDPMTEREAIQWCDDRMDDGAWDWWNVVLYR